MIIDYVARLLLHITWGRIEKLKFNGNAVETSFRCWPIDIDLYMHMNNAKYVRVAEMARWRLFPATGAVKQMGKDGIMFLVTDQRVSYYKPIQPFQRYVVQTSITFDKNDDKWMYYSHAFMQHPTLVKPGSQPIKYALVELKVSFTHPMLVACIILLRVILVPTQAVAKESNGKTIRASSMAAMSELNSRIMLSLDRPFAWTAATSDLESTTCKGTTVT